MWTLEAHKLNLLTSPLLVKSAISRHVGLAFSLWQISATVGLSLGPVKLLGNGFYCNLGHEFVVFSDSKHKNLLSPFVQFPLISNAWCLFHFSFLSFPAPFPAVLHHCCQSHSSFINTHTYKSAVRSRTVKSKQQWFCWILTVKIIRDQEAFQSPLSARTPCLCPNTPNNETGSPCCAPRQSTSAPMVRSGSPSLWMTWANVWTACVEVCTS